ncbi:MAG: hypothetical protein AAF196_13285 [Planctomycetota bacterium]
MIAVLLWFFLAPWICLLDGELATRTPLRIDLGAAQCLALVLWIRTPLIVPILVGTAVARSLWMGGDIALHMLALGLPVAIALPARSILNQHSLSVQALCGASLSLLIPRLSDALAGVIGQPAVALPVGVFDGFAALLFVPVLARLLVTFPPLRLARVEEQIQ